MHLVEATDLDFLHLIEGRAPRGLRLPPDGVEQIEVLTMLRGLSNTVRPTFDPASWMMVEAGEVVGLCSIVKKPNSDGIDIGYGVSIGRRRMGFATKAVEALLEWARNDGRVRHIRAETSIHNTPSQRVLECNGFERVGQRVDEEDGELICWIAVVAH